MAKEVLYVSEDYLPEVILVIRTGLKGVPKGKVSKDVREMLTTWCDEEEAYITAPEEPLGSGDREADAGRGGPHRGRPACRAGCARSAGCGHSLLQHKGYKAGGRCHACRKCKNFVRPRRERRKRQGGRDGRERTVPSRLRQRRPTARPA